MSEAAAPPVDHEADLLRQVALSARGLALAVALGSIGLVLPGWVLHWLGVTVDLRLPALASGLILLLGLLAALGVWGSVRNASRSPWIVRSAWFAVSGTPLLLALLVSSSRPTELAPFLFDIVPILWTASITLSVLLLSPGTSVAIGLWCALQYAVVYAAAAPQLSLLQGPDELILELSGVGGAVRRVGLLALLGLMTGGASAIWRRTVIDRFRQRELARNTEALLLVAEAERLQAELEAHQTEATSQAKSRFIAEMSHELRAPLTGILGLGGALEAASGPNPELQGIAAAVMRNARHLSELVADATDRALVESGRVTLNLRPFDVRELVEEVAAVFLVASGKRGLALHTEVRSEVPPQLVGDSRRVRQVLLNLVSNATRHTPEGQVNIRVRGVAPVTFEVSDTGRGMSPQELDGIFRAFSQVGTTEERAGGMGLGLSITRTLAQAMGGDVRIESTRGVGTAATVWLPLSDASGWTPASEGAAAEGSAVVQVFPDAETLARLRTLAELGDLGGLRTILDSLRDQPRLHPFVEAVEAHSRRFDHDAILLLLESRVES